MSRILILGGGVGGIAAANTLRSMLPAEHKITIIDVSGKFAMGATKTWVMLGERTPEQVTRSVSSLKRRNIDVKIEQILHIDAQNCKVTTRRGVVEGDFMIVALGADVSFGGIEGLEGRTHSFYTMKDAVRLRDALKQFRGGDLLLLIPQTPFKCPPAPYEAAMLLHHYFKKLGKETRIEIYTVEGAPMATAGPEIGAFVKSELAARTIGYFPQRRVKAVDTKSVVFQDGTEAKYNLLIAVPPHSSPKVVRDSGLANQGGWIPVDGMTLRMTGPAAGDRCYAVGDVTVLSLPGRFKPDVPLVLPKAGVFADAQARTAAAQIASRVLGRESAEAFDGKGFCYIEMGDSHAVRGDGSFFDLPNPTMKKRVPDLMQMEEKRQWVDGWMKRNLGQLDGAFSR